MSEHIDRDETPPPRGDRQRKGSRVNATILGVVFGTRLHQGDDEDLEGDVTVWYGFEPVPALLENLPGLRDALDALHGIPNLILQNQSFGIDMTTGAWNLFYDDDGEDDLEENHSSTHDVSGADWPRILLAVHLAATSDAASQLPRIGR